MISLSHWLNNVDRNRHDWLEYPKRLNKNHRFFSLSATIRLKKQRRPLKRGTDIFTFPDALMAVVMGAAGVTARDNSGDPRSTSNYVTSPQSHKRLRRQRVETKECTRCAAAAVAGRVVLLVAASPTQRYHLTRGSSINYVRQVLLSSKKGYKTIKSC